MKVIKFPSQPDNDSFFKEIIEEGYHIFSLENAKNPNYYPNDFPDYPGVNVRNLKIGDVVTVRAFFKVGSGKNVRADGGYLDLEIEHIEDDSVFGVIMYKAKMTEH